MDDNSLELFAQGQAMRDIFAPNLMEFMDDFQALDTKQKRDTFEQQARPATTEFWNRYKQRKAVEQLMPGQPVAAAPVAATVTAPKPFQFLPVQEPEMGWKATRKKNAALKKSAEATKEDTTLATKYTGYINEVMNQRKEKGYADWDESQSIEDGIPLVSEVLSKQWNPDVFQPEFFGKNFEYVSREVEKARLVVQNYGEGTPGFDVFSVGQKERMKAFTETMVMINDCYEKALAVHGIEHAFVNQVDMGYQQRNGADPNAKANLDAATAALRTNITDFDHAIDQKIAQKVDAEFQALLPQFEQEYTAMQDDLMREYPRVQSRLFSRLNYEDIAKYYDLLDEPAYSENVQKNSKVIHKALADFVHLNEVVTDYKIRAMTYSDMQAKFRAQYGAPGTYDADTKKIFSELDARIDQTAAEERIYDITLADLAMVLNHLIKGSKDMNPSGWLMLEEYGYQGVQGEYQKEGEKAKFYKTRIEAKYRVMEEAIRRRFPNADQAKIDSYTKGNTGRAVMLMKVDDDAYNDSVMEMLVKRETMLEYNSQLQSIKGPGQPPFTEGQKLRFMDAIHEAVSASEPILQEKIDLIMHADLSAYEKLTPAELVEKQGEIMEIVVSSMMVSDLMKSPSDVVVSDHTKTPPVEKRFTLKEKLLGRPAYAEPSVKDKEAHAKYEADMAAYEQRAKILSARKTIIDGYRVMSRGHALQLEGARRLADPKTAMTEGDLQRFTGMDYAHLDQHDAIIVYGSYQIDLGKRTIEVGKGQLEKALNPVQQEEKKDKKKRG